MTAAPSTAQHSLVDTAVGTQLCSSLPVARLHEKHHVKAVG